MRTLEEILEAQKHAYHVTKEEINRIKEYLSARITAICSWEIPFFDEVVKYFPTEYNYIRMYQPDEKVKFPNGFVEWMETHHEIVSAITYQLSVKGSLPYKTMEESGTGGIYELAETLTDKFETQNKGREWDGEFYDEIEKFTSKELL